MGRFFRSTPVSLGPTIEEGEISVPIATQAELDAVNNAAEKLANKDQANGYPGLDASSLLAAARIPNLDAAKIASGTLDAARIPDLDAAKIISGILAAARLGSGTPDATKYLRGDGAWASAPAAAFRGCFIYASTDQSYSTGVAADRAFDSELFDTDAFHDVATNNHLITIPVGLGGKYLGLSQFGWAAVSGTTMRHHSIRKPDATLLAASGKPAAPNDVDSSICGFVRHLNDGDQLRVQAYQASGGALNSLGGNAWTWLLLVRLGD